MLNFSIRENILHILFAIIIIMLIIFGIWFTLAQWDSCMNKFNDWFYCLKHIS